jgi:hypothetical protein
MATVRAAEKSSGDKMLGAFHAEWISNPFHLISKPGIFTSFILEMEAEAGAGEMAQRLRTLTVLLEVLSSHASNHMVAYNHL